MAVILIAGVTLKVSVCVKLARIRNERTVVRPVGHAVAINIRAADGDGRTALVLVVDDIGVRKLRVGVGDDLHRVRAAGRAIHQIVAERVPHLIRSHAQFNEVKPRSLLARPDYRSSQRVFRRVTIPTLDFERRPTDRRADHRDGQVNVGRPLAVRDRDVDPLGMRKVLLRHHVETARLRHLDIVVNDPLSQPSAVHL